MTLRHARTERYPTIEYLNDEAQDHRERAEAIVCGVDALMRRFAALEVVPLDVLDRMERLIVTAHTANLLRLSQYGELRGDE